VPGCAISPNERRRLGYRRLFILLRREGEPSGINAEHFTATGHHTAPTKSFACRPVAHTAPEGVLTAMAPIAAG
jgi:hypothetical protein